MLESRPNLQKSLIGFGAFSFVFLAAMSGTAFMISGGFDLNPPERSQQIGARDYVNLVQDRWSDWAAPQASARTYAPATYTPEQAPPASDAAVVADAGDDLDGSGDGATPVRDRTEAEIARDIDAEYAAMQAQERARQAANQQAIAAADEDYVKDGEY